MSGTTSFSVPHARDLVKDLFHHRPVVYWTDFLVTISIGYSAAVVYFNARLFSPLQVASLFITGFALFRLGSFIHEIVHFRGKEMRSFVIGWNILAGIPLLSPSFFYGNHIGHHSTRHYGTGQDGEYLPLGSGVLREILYFYLQVLVLPVAILFRFLIVTPISFMHPGVRKWALERYSSFVINIRYRHEIPPNAPRAAWAALEFCCFLRAAAMVGFWATGLVPVTRLPLIYVLAVLTLGLNYVRNLVAHRYESDGRPMSHVDQLQDSINLEGTPVLTELFFPVGLRYHALHHLFPTLPYHHLGAAHRRLLAALPAGSSYHQTVVPGFWTAAKDVVRKAWIRQRRPSAGLHAGRAAEWYARRTILHEGRRDTNNAPVVLDRPQTDVAESALADLDSRGTNRLNRAVEVTS